MGKKEEMIARIKELAPKGKITCTNARKVATEFKVEPAEVGELCDEIKIKIYACELGCFK